MGIEVWVAIWVASAAFGAIIGANKNRAGEGFLLGLLLGVIGLAITVVLPPKPVLGQTSSATPPTSTPGVQLSASERADLEARLRDLAGGERLDNATLVQIRDVTQNLLSS
ncbi:MAG: hypothetical protein AAGA99_08980 [Actinomycetota bacterium]